MIEEPWWLLSEDPEERVRRAEGVVGAAKKLHGRIMGHGGCGHRGAGDGPGDDESGLLR